MIKRKITFLCSGLFLVCSLCLANTKEVGFRYAWEHSDENLVRILLSKGINPNKQLKNYYWESKAKKWIQNIQQKMQKEKELKKNNLQRIQQKEDIYKSN